ncbi:MAG: FAD-dependent oxidoreductase [Gemmatimonadota bacterium]|nr:FAD-dependent oxidoreductase [Gemmatimonadota bacterium]MDE2871023.1 FAD-dependent oxidoreductase [Gemmatimonadota bacterium]
MKRSGPARIHRRSNAGRACPRAAKVAVIGAGIVGNCLVEHLAKLGWDDLVLIDKGPLPDPGGSTGHASNFIFPVDHAREIALITLESQRQYEALGVNTTCGGVEVARTEARMEELRRRMTSARVWGIESELLTPAEVVARVPFVNPDVILGGFYTPGVSVVDSVRAGTIMRERALARGVLTVLEETEVTGLEVDPVPFGRPRVRAVATTRGTIEVDHAVIACGVWSPRIAAMAGATIPLTPAVHQMADFGPVELLLATGNEIGYPIVRDMDSFMYERQSGGAMEVGSYAHRPILVRPEEIPSIAEAERSPTELPFTPGDFAPQLERAHEIMGDLLAGTEMQYAVNGLLSLTPDTQQLLGETAEVANLWSAAAVWVREGPGSARLIAEWMTHGYPRLLDPHESDVTRFQPHERTGRHVRTRCREHFRKTYGIVHPREQWESARGVARSPFHPRTEALGAEYFEARGWERPQWYASNEDLVARYDVPDRPHEWDRRWWSPIVNAEHLHLREKVGVVDLGAFRIFDVSGPGALPYLERMTVNACDRPVGSSIYTRTEPGLALWDAIRSAGRQFDARPVGIGVYGTTARMEKGYLLMGAELTSEYSPVEAGLARRRVKETEFIGKAAYLEARERGPAARICTLTMDDHLSASGVARFPTGGNEPILTPEGDRIVDALGRESRVTSAGMGPSVGEYLLMAWLPAGLDRVGERLQVMYMNECFPVTVAAVGVGLFDPAGGRMRG